jgi:hypothetical protein
LLSTLRMAVEAFLVLMRPDDRRLVNQGDCLKLPTKVHQRLFPIVHSPKVLVLIDFLDSPWLSRTPSVLPG